MIYYIKESGCMNLFSLTKEKTLVLKSFAILFVLLGHTNYLYRSGAWGVQLFLILSGFGVMSSYFQKGNKKYFYRKFLNLLVPYSIVILFQIIALNDISRMTIKQFVVSLIGLDFNLNIDSTMWFISYVWVWYIAFYIFTYIAEKLKVKNKYFILILLLIFSIFLLLISRENVIWSLDSGTPLYFLAFPTGCILCCIQNIKITKTFKILLYVLGLLILTTIFIYFYNREINVMEYAMFSFSGAVIPLILISLYNFKYKFKLLQLIGKSSYSIYLIEAFILNFRYSVLGFINYTPVIDFVTMFLIIILGVIIDNYIFKKIISKFSH